jgi:hypothetical protein
MWNSKKSPAPTKPVDDEFIRKTAKLKEKDFRGDNECTVDVRARARGRVFPEAARM